MKQFRNIVISKDEPNKSSIWLNEGILKYYGPKGWTDIISTAEKAELINLIQENTVSPEGEISPIYVFSVNNTEEDKRLNKELAADILFDKVLAVKIKGRLNNVDYDTIGVYSNGYISAIQESKHLVFSVNFETGEMEVLTSAEVDKMLPFVKLMIGNEESVMQFNIEHLMSGSFFVSLGVGYGVGEFQPDTGGFLHITTAKGHETFYEISKEGAITKNDKYIKPNEPYTVQIEANLIGETLDDITASKVSDAGEIVINGLTGPITYTRAADSTKSMVYFTDDRKDGKMSLITYNTLTKRLSHVDSFVPVGPATNKILGGIKKGKSIPNASSEELLNTVNTLLVTLREIGVIEK